MARRRSLIDGPRGGGAKFSRLDGSRSSVDNDAFCEGHRTGRGGSTRAVRPGLKSGIGASTKTSTTAPLARSARRQSCSDRSATVRLVAASRAYRQKPSCLLSAESPPNAATARRASRRKFRTCVRVVPWKSSAGSRRRRGHDVDIPRKLPQSKRGHDVDIPWRSSAEAGRSDAAATTWIFRGDGSRRTRPRRGYFRRYLPGKRLSTPPRPRRG